VSDSCSCRSISVIPEVKLPEPTQDAFRWRTCKVETVRADSARLVVTGGQVGSDDAVGSDRHAQTDGARRVLGLRRD
jgi:hypothetical protein